MLKLDPEQERLRDSVTEGPTLVKGGPGTGKSTLEHALSLQDKPYQAILIDEAQDLSPAHTPQ